MDADYSRILKPWDVVRVMIRDSGSWLTDVVYRLRPAQSQIDVGLDSLQEEMQPRPGDPVRIKHVAETSELLIHGNVIASLTSFPPSLSVTILDQQAYPYARDAKRYDVNLSAILKADSAHENGTFASISNISASGMSFSTHMEIGELLGLRATEPEQLRVYTEIFVRPDKILTLEGSLVRNSMTERGYDYGMRFAPGANKRLQMYLFTLEDEETGQRQHHLSLFDTHRDGGGM